MPVNDVPWARQVEAPAADAIVANIATSIRAWMDLRFIVESSDN